MRTYLRNTLTRSLLIHEGNIVPKEPLREIPLQTISLMVLLYKLNLSVHPAHNLHHEPA